jgi:glycine/D-amino acid oxidase-like deaminating enzyme
MLRKSHRLIPHNWWSECYDANSTRRKRLELFPVNFFQYFGTRPTVDRRVPHIGGSDEMHNALGWYGSGVTTMTDLSNRVAQTIIGQPAELAKA